MTRMLLETVSGCKCVAAICRAAAQSGDSVTYGSYRGHSALLPQGEGTHTHHVNKKT